MGSERATESGPGGAGEASEIRGQIVPFPERRAFGPLSWRTVRAASRALLLLIALGAVVQLLVEHYLLDLEGHRPSASQARP
jgi:hypothetical protein